MNTLLAKTKLVIVILIISGLFIPQRIDTQLSVAKWEKLLSVILYSNRTTNTATLDVNQDGTIDIKDLCVLYSKFSEGDKGSGKKQIRILEAVVNRNLDTHLSYKQFGKSHYSNYNSSFLIQPIILWICPNKPKDTNRIDNHKLGKGIVGVFALRC